MDQIAQFLPLLIMVFTGITIYFDAPKRGMSKLWILIAFANIIGLIIYFIARKPLLATQNKVVVYTPNNLVRNEKSIEQTLIIPDSCPHCKNPNTKKIRLCEWCGNQII